MCFKPHIALYGMDAYYARALRTHIFELAAHLSHTPNAYGAVNHEYSNQNTAHITARRAQDLACATIGIMSVPSRRVKHERAIYL